MESTLYQRFLKDTRFKVTKTPIPYSDSKALLADIALKDRNNEDKLYKKDPNLQSILRRGTSFLIINKKVSWARKGQKKFFEFKNENIPSDLQSTSIYKTIKANGENAQISFNLETSSWIIGSKNVSLAARTESDLEFYSSLRFNFAKMIALTWFKILSKVDNKEELKAEMTGKSFIGEYVGNPDCQHIIKYDEVNIQFFAIVNHSDDSNYCEKTREAFQVFRRFGLPFVWFEEVIIEKSAFENRFQEILVEIKELSIEVANEGVVFYFNGESGVEWMCKVKCLEYKYLRKLREKIKDNEKNGFKEFCNYIRGQEKNTGRNLEKFIEKAKSIVNDETNSKTNLQNNFASILSEPERKVFISIGIPGMGKSHIIPKLQSLYPSLCVVSSDQTRSSVMSNLQTEKPHFSHTDLFNRTKKSGKALFESELKSASFPLYIDKNFPPLGFTLPSLSGASPYSTVAFYQKSSTFQLGEKFWPFSLEVLYTCIQRVLNRKNHETLIDPVNSVQVCIMMYNLYQNFNFSYYLKHGVDKLVPASYIDEAQVVLPPEFKVEICSILKGLKPGKLPNPEQVHKVMNTVDQNVMIINEIIIGENIPVFIGIHVELKALHLVIPAIEGLIKENHDRAHLQEDLTEIKEISAKEKRSKNEKNKWQINEKLHITVLFIGKNSKVLHSEFFKEFRIGLQYSFVISHFVYCPRKLIIAVVKFLGDKPLISNKVPHITIMNKKTPGKFSNEVLNNIEITEQPSLQTSCIGDCFCIPIESDIYTGVSQYYFN